MSAPSLFIGSVEIPQNFTSITQTYEKRSAREDTRMADGSLYRRVHWSGKLASNINVSGVNISALSNIDFDTPHVLKCVTPIGITGTGSSNVITLPVGGTYRRTDVTPFGEAYVDGSWVETGTTSLVGDVLTLNTVSGATMYKGFYYPQFTALFSDPSESFSGGRISSWSISCEEV